MGGEDNEPGAAQADDRLTIETAEVLLPAQDIAKDLAFWTSSVLGFRMEQIYPADDPQVAVLSGHGLRLRLDKAATTNAGAIRLLYRGVPAERVLISPSGTQVEFASADTDFIQPPTQHAFITRRLKDNASWVIGRAGMHYRDLIPSRLGGAIIASHIRIPKAGPVPDSVHYHAIGFQLIYCYVGWVRLVYEDQGPPFILHAGDCVIQPPQIRHRVLESSENLQVVEVGVPAEHMTTIDHDMVLPTPTHRPEREWDGQRFVHSLAKDAVWKPWRIPGFEARDTGISDGTKDVAAVCIARPLAVNLIGGVVTSHDCNILLTFVLSGSCTLYGDGEGAHKLTEGDAYTLPPGHKTMLSAMSEDLSLLEVALPAQFHTAVY
ncbi:putative rmlC-like cupin domain superfamily, rmlC-like jelly roll protein [Septoria linicola]|nr:putative rmlC-like cupin domain superfamily, rmlC-like jelly roll protein [Septoria linicola]